MRIAMISTPSLSTPPQKYGGIERVVSTLTETLVQRGHDVTLFAAKGSKTNARLVEIFDDTDKTHFNNISQHISLIHTLKRINKEYGTFDIFHNHNYYVFDKLVNYHAPVITTMHNLVELYDLSFSKAYHNSQYICVSKSHEATAKENGFNVRQSIYNPIDCNAYTFFPVSGKDLVFLGALNYTKGAHIAIDIANRTGMSLKIAGPITDKDYFSDKIKPGLTNKRIEFLGEINDSEKAALFRNAYCLLFPILHKEPFGLVMIEAMAFGVPVIGFHLGSVPEIIENEKTGYVVHNTTEMIKAVEKVSRLNKAACRNRVEELFSADTAAKAYEGIYHEIRNGLILSSNG